MKTEVVMMLKAEIVAEGGIQTVRDEATLEKYVKAINAYPKLVELASSLRAELVGRPNMGLAVKHIDDLLREIEEVK
jgi:hypothetical protein